MPARAGGFVGRQSQAFGVRKPDDADDGRCVGDELHGLRHPCGGVPVRRCFRIGRRRHAVNSAARVSTGFFQRSSTGTTVVSLISSMTKEADTSDSGTFAISRW